MWWGYVRSLLDRKPRYNDLEFRAFLRRYQWACLVLGKERATRGLDETAAPRNRHGKPTPAENP
jgi:poly-beta-1,6-N-acetyl-D-glucosamine synthase